MFICCYAVTLLTSQPPEARAGQRGRARRCVFVCVRVCVCLCVCVFFFFSSFV